MTPHMNDENHVEVYLDSRYLRTTIECGNGNLKAFEMVMVMAEMRYTYTPTNVLL